MTTPMACQCRRQRRATPRCWACQQNTSMWCSTGKPTLLATTASVAAVTGLARTATWRPAGRAGDEGGLHS